MCEHLCRREGTRSNAVSCYDSIMSRTLYELVPAHTYSTPAFNSSACTPLVTWLTNGRDRALIAVFSLHRKKKGFYQQAKPNPWEIYELSVYLGLIVWGSLSVFPLFACPATAQCTSIIQRRSLGFQCKANHRWSSVLMGSCYTWLLCSKT